jgi:hypothetical protein
LPGGARYEYFENDHSGYGQQNPWNIEQDAAAHDPDHHREQVKLDRSAQDKRFVNNVLEHRYDAEFSSNIARQQLVELLPLRCQRIPKGERIGL